MAHRIIEEKICFNESCNITFPVTTKKRNRKYCSKSCADLNKVKKITLSCLICNKYFIVILSKSYRKYCSNECKKLAPISDETKAKIKKTLTGTKHTEDRILKMSNSKLGTIAWNKGIPMSEETKEKLQHTFFKKGFKHTLETRKKMSMFRKGQKNNLWKGGITSINKQIRGSLEYKLWREAIFERDNWTCQFCNQRGGKLNADHIKSFANFPELRFDLDNGRTLCINCHKNTPTYLKQVTKEQEEILMY